MREEQLKSHLRKSVGAGSIIALAGSVYISQMFRPGLLSLPWFIAWHVISLLCGGGAGFIGGLLVDLIPIRLSPAVSYLVGALAGAFGFYWQVRLFLLYMFRHNPTSF